MCALWVDPRRLGHAATLSLMNPSLLIAFGASFFFVALLPPFVDTTRPLAPQLLALLADR